MGFLGHLGPKEIKGSQGGQESQERLAHQAYKVSQGQSGWENQVGTACLEDQVHLDRKVSQG